MNNYHIIDANDTEPILLLATNVIMATNVIIGNKCYDGTNWWQTNGRASKDQGVVLSDIIALRQSGNQQPTTCLGLYGAILKIIIIIIEHCQYDTILKTIICSFITIPVNNQALIAHPIIQAATHDLPMALYSKSFASWSLSLATIRFFLHTLLSRLGEPQ